MAVRNGFSVYDALIVASAMDASCAPLLSADLQPSLVPGEQLTLRNPFWQAPPGR